MTKEEILQEAKLRYPTGTRVRSLQTSLDDEYSGTINWEIFTELGVNVRQVHIKDDELYLPTVESNGNRRAFVYYRGKWADITSKTLSAQWEELKIKLNI